MHDNAFKHQSFLSYAMDYLEKSFFPVIYIQFTIRFKLWYLKRKNRGFKGQIIAVLFLHEISIKTQFTISSSIIMAWVIEKGYANAKLMPFYDRH